MRPVYSCFGEEVIRVAVQDQSANRFDGNQLFRYQFCCIQHIEAKLFRLFFGKDLHTQIPLRIITSFNRLPEVSAMEIRICA